MLSVERINRHVCYQELVQSGSRRLVSEQKLCTPVTRAHQYIHHPHQQVRPTGTIKLTGYLLPQSMPQGSKDRPSFQNEHIGGTGTFAAPLHTQNARLCRLLPCTRQLSLCCPSLHRPALQAHQRAACVGFRCPSRSITLPLPSTSSALSSLYTNLLYSSRSN